MKQSNNRVKSLINNIIQGGLEHSDIEAMRKIKMINIMSIIAMAILIPLGTVDLIQGSHTVGLFVLVISAMLLCNQYYLRRSGNYLIPIYCGTSIVALYFVYALVAGGVNNTGHLWYFTFPLFALFLLGARRGSLATILLLFSSIGFFLYEPRSPLFTVYSTDFKIRFVLSYSVIFLFSYLFEDLRKKSQLTLTLANVELQESKKELQQTHDELELRIEERTADLRKVNEQLEREVEEHRKTGQALRESEERYRNIFEQSRDPIYITTREGWFVDVNRSFMDLFGYRREEIGDLNAIDAYSDPKDRLTFQRAVERDGAVIDFELKLRKKNGEEIDCLLTTTVRKSNDENILGYQGIIRDITEHKQTEEQRKRLETQLQYAQRMEALGTLAGGIAHNFNNLLMGILGNTSLMLLDTERESPEYEKLRKIEKLIDSGSMLTKQLLGYAREGRYEVEPIDINQVVKETSDTFAMTKKNIAVHQELNELLYVVKADQSQIEQVLWNLYINAADAMPTGGDLFLRTRNVTDKEMPDKQPYKITPGNYVLLTVMDTGTGMDRKTKEHIFEPFFTTKGLSKGTGLGLASAYGMVKAHGGYIDVESKEGKGTTFNIYLPASQERFPKKEVRPEKIEEGKEILLLVDDEAIVLEVGQKMLEIMGYTVYTAGGGKEAMEIFKARHNTIDMVILDMIMPDMGGGETYDKLKQINPNVKVLLSSGYSIHSQASEILKRGCDGFIQKPFELPDLSRKLRDILEKGS
jgi:two-component system cell cycle sensor histidine kinase/response regulator CckA